MIKRIFTFVVIISMLLPICAYENAASVTAKKQTNTKKKFTMTVGQKKSLKLKKDTKIKWKSSNKKVVFVSKKGVIKAKKQGKAKITARFSGKKVQYIVKVVKKNIPVQAEPSNIPAATTSTADISVQPTPAPKPTPTMLCNGRPTPTPTRTPRGIVKIFFNVNNEVITTSTTNISGTMNPYRNTIFIIKVNGNEILRKDYVDAVEEYSIDVDFSNYSSGDEVIIERVYDTENGTSTIAAWKDSKTFLLFSTADDNWNNGDMIIPPNKLEFSGELYVYMEEPYTSGSIDELFPELDIEHSYDFYKNAYEKFYDVNKLDITVSYYNKIGTTFIIYMRDKSDSNILNAYDVIKQTKGIKNVEIGYKCYPAN